MSILYVDTSALLKRIVVEPESGAVRALLRRRNADGDLLVSSSLTWLEVWRAVRRSGAAGNAALVRRALSGIAEFPLAEGTLVRARSVGLGALRSLDAIHCAAALDVGADALLTYDLRLAESAAAEGIAVHAPI